MLQKVCFHVGTRNLVRGHVTAFKKAANTPRRPSAHDIRIALDSARQRARHRGRKVRFIELRLGLRTTTATGGVFAQGLSLKATIWRPSMSTRRRCGLLMMRRSALSLRDRLRALVTTLPR